MTQLPILFVAALFVAGTYGIGPACEGGRSCVQGQASCQGGQCVCAAPSVWGAGTFACYKKNQVAAEIKNDPMLTNFNNETLPFPFPCRYLVTHLKQNLKDRNRNVIGQCEFKIHAFNAKHRGKFFVHGFDVAAKITYKTGQVVNLSSRNYGLAEDNKYSFTTKGTDGDFLPNGPWGSDKIKYRDDQNDIEVEVFTDDRNHQLIYSFKKCGLYITFVPYDIVKRRSQPVVPGVSVGINCAMKPQWLGYDNVMALSPSWEGGALFKDMRLPKITAEQSILSRAFTRGYTHNQPYDDDGACDLGTTVFKRCNNDQRATAMNSCYWMMKEPRFLRCVDTSKSSKKATKLFVKCVDMFCGNTECKDVMKMVSDTGCSNVRGISKLPSFMTGQLCP